MERQIRSNRLTHWAVRRRHGRGDSRIGRRRLGRVALQIALAAGLAVPVLAGPASAAETKLAYGVDVSRYDQGFDWSRPDVAFGFAKATERRVDPTFARNWREMRKNGVVRGAYHFARPARDPIQQADFFLRTVREQGLLPGDLLVLDLEVNDGRSTREVNAWAKRWLERVYDKTGVRPMFYSSWSFAQQYGDGLEEYPLWVAHYGRDKGEVDAPEPWNDWAIHQYAATDHDHNVSKLSPQQLTKLGVPARPKASAQQNPPARKNAAAQQNPRAPRASILIGQPDSSQ